MNPGWVLYNLLSKAYRDKGGKKKIPPKQKAFIKAWALLHEDELSANWYLAQNSGEPFAIKGLE